MFLPRIHTHKKVKGTVVNDNKKKNLLLGALNTKSSLRTGQGDASNASVKWEKKKEKKAFDIVRLHRGERRWQLRTPQKGTTQPTVWWGEKHRTAHQQRYTFRFSYCCLNGLSNVLYIRYINSELNLGYCQRFFMAELFFPFGLLCLSPPCSPPSSS